MSLDYNNLLKNFQSVVVSYQDIAAIYTKLASQGQIQKLAALFNEIYDEEHVFTLTELQRYCRENDQKEDDFVAEQYELNANIFRRNLTLIVQSLVEEVGKSFLDRFKQEFSNRTPVEKDQAYENQAELSYEKAQYKSNMPEIQEETEQSAGIQGTNNSSTFRKMHEHEYDQEQEQEQEEEQEQPNPSQNKFDLNINDLNKRIPAKSAQSQPSHLQMPNFSSQSYDNRPPSQPQEYRQPRTPVRNEEPIRRQYQTEQERDEMYQQAASSLRNEEGYNSQTEPRYDGFNQYDNESIDYKANLQRYYKQPVQENNFKQFQGNHWSSPERSKALAQKHMTPSTNASQRKTKPTSPERYNSISSPNSYMNRSMSKWSSSNERPDPSVLDSEFSYGGGASFSKSPKKFHFDINKVPGPGHYEFEESKKMVRVMAPDHSFSKSPKVPSYIKKNNHPGFIYYPIKSVCSK